MIFFTMFVHKTFVSKVQNSTPQFVSQQSRNLLRFGQRYSRRNPRKWPPCCLVHSASDKLHQNMARKRPQSTKEQKRSSKKTFSAPRGGVNIKSNAICAKNSRSSTTRARSVKRDLKSTDAPSKSTATNPGDSNDIAKEKGGYSLDKDCCELKPAKATLVAFVE